MVNYGEAFKLPFTNWQRLLLLVALYIGGTVLPILPVAGFYAQIFSLSLQPGQTGAELPSFAGVNWIMFAILGVVALVIWLVIGGYFLRIARNAARGRNELPKFEDVLGMISMSLKAIAGFIVYSILIVLALLPIFALMFGPAGLKVVGVMLLIVFFLAALVAAYVLSAVIVGFAAENRFLALFSFKRGIKYAFTAAFFIPWVVGVGYALGLNYIGQLVTMVPFYSVMLVNPVWAIITMMLLYTPIAVIASITSMNLEGQGYHAAMLAKKNKK